jgi:hypothetical protein
LRCLPGGFTIFETIVLIFSPRLDPRSYPMNDGINVGFYQDQIMSVDYQQVRKQVQQLGETAPARERQSIALREKARQHLQEFAHSQQELREKVLLAARHYDPNLRCALPVDESLSSLEALDGCFPLPPLPVQATILAADGSQIAPDRHAEVAYGLVNLGAIQMRLGSTEPPLTRVESSLIYDEQLYTPSGAILSDDALALQRDLSEREMLKRLAETALPPMITFTDGPIELWGAKDAGDTAEFKKSLDIYLEALKALSRLEATTAGYVDKPLASLVVRLLEVAITPADELSRLKDLHPLGRVTDLGLFRDILGAGGRSAVFAIQSKSAGYYKEAISLHFFYLNVGREGHPHLARVEIPAWVAADPLKLDNLHAALVSQCRIMGGRPYPYLLHRAHETAVVTQDEKTQITQMIILELHKRGAAVGEASNKQFAKELESRTRYPR